MEELRRQVASARWRMNLQQFLGVLPWALLMALAVAVVGIAVPKVWVLPVDSQIWFTSWLAGAVGMGLLMAVVWTVVRRRPALDAALEIDRRFGLKERVSSVLSLNPTELDTEVGQALLHDAVRRVEKLEVREKFALSLNTRALLPLLPVLLAVGVMLLPDAQEKAKASASVKAEVREQIQRSAETLQARLAKKREQAEASGLKDADEIFKRLQQGLDEVSKDSSVDHQKALVKINDLAKDLERRRQAIGDADTMRKQLDGLKNIERGPADSLAKAMKEGNFEKAVEQLQQLQDKLASGDLSPEEKEQLTKQLQQMHQKMQEMANAHQEAKAELERQIQQKMAEGDLEGAGKLQRKLDQLEQQDSQMQRMEQMASKLGEASEAMQNGDMKSVQAKLGEVSDQLQEMEADMQQLASIDELMDEIGDAKSAMNCEQCNGAGCASCQGGKGDFASNRSSDQVGGGNGIGDGQGAGYGPEQETETGVYESQVRGTPKAGEAVRVGDASGPNKAGVTQESLKTEILSAVKNEADPLSDQRLPKDQQDHVREYYKRFKQ